MATETSRTVLTDAWGHIPAGRVPTGDLGSFTRSRIERIIQLVVGFGCLALGTQAFVAALAGDSGVLPGRSTVLIAVTFGILALMILACAVGRGVRPLAAVFAVEYPILLIIWPFVTTDSQLSVQSEPWIFYLVNVATVAAVLAFPLLLQIVWTAVVPLMFGVVRLLQDGFSDPLRISVSLDVSFTLILGGVLITLAWLFRAMAVNVDETRAVAVASYSAAAAAAAAEEERVAVAGLMHDSVLAALIAAARTQTPRERQLAVQMAREALTRLANADSAAEEGSDEPVSIDGIADEIERLARDLGLRLRVDRAPAEGVPPLTGRVAHAIVLATAQAVANSVEHADAAGIAVSLAPMGASGVSVVVRDEGPGFDLALTPPDRLGIRGSIIARLDAVGGHARIDSAHGGTTVTLTWEQVA
ncbi:MAG TPA: ATP-binding protein [Microbacterium sp.]|nr:ATP-binding protein [Microbacterium sp.]